MTLRGNHPDELISASLTGDLTDVERTQLDAHLARCERCRATLTAFKAERRILSGLPVADAPRDLSARVRSGIDSGRLRGPWWRRPAGLVALVASAATVAAAVLAIVVVNNMNPGPVGQESGSPEATVSSAPTGSEIASIAPSVAPSAPPTFLAAGQLGYLSLNGGSFEPSQLTFINDATGASLDLGTVSGPPIVAALSPDGQWLAYITQKGETGANEVWALHLADGSVIPLGCSIASPFADRLAWAPDGAYLGYTLIATDLGPNAGCPPTDGTAGSADAWLFDTAIGERSRLTTSGDAYAASFLPNSDQRTLLVSHAAETPSTEAVPFVADDTTFEKLDGVFLPLFSPDGNRALFWSGTMASSNGVWQFSRGGMPQLSGDFRASGPASPWLGTPLFNDLIPAGGEAFASGDFAWAPDSDQFAFWDGAWKGAPQSADGTYPDQRAVYGSSVTGGLLSEGSRTGLDLVDGAWIVDVAISNSNLAITIGLPSAGVGDPPSAYVQIFHDEGGDPRIIGGGVEPPPWDGPVVYGR